MAEKIGRYEILEEIGRGGFATVYRARDTALARLVALKELRPVLLQDTEWVARFHREGRTIARLDHPHIVPVYDVYETGSRLFIVMRLVTGPTLEERINQARYLAWPEAVEIIKAVAWGLDYAHEQGILHRDLKPGNILLDPERGAMLTDFGMAKLVGDTAGSVTGAGGIVGTPHYIAPEIWEGQGTSRQSDIYALGCLLYEMVTGEKVFRGETPPAVMMAHFRPLELPRQWPEGIPPGLAPILQKALARQPADRYATAGEMAKALTALPSVQPTPKGAPASFVAPAGNPAEVASSPDVALEPEDEFEREERRLAARRDRWRGFLSHLGPYLIVNAMLVGIYLLTDPGGYPWFIWPALGWGVGVAFHLMGLMLDEMQRLSDKWRGFLAHLGSYSIIIGMLMMIYLFTDPGGYPWFVWPALGWGAAVFIHLWSAMLGGDHRELHEGLHDAWHGSREGLRTARRERRAEGRRGRGAEAQGSKGAGEQGSRSVEEQRRRSAEAQERGGAGEQRRRGAEALNPVLRAHLEKARTYQAQINALLTATSDRNVHLRLQDLANQVQEWMDAVEALAQRVDRFQRNNIIQHDLESVPQAIANLERQLAAESDPATQAELERTLSNRRNQLAALEHLRRTMKRAEIKIESTLSSLGTIYSQMLISQSTDHVADYSRLSADVDEEVRTLQDHLEALEEVRLGGV